jgi:cation diffusion facilitator family transporter
MNRRSVARYAWLSIAAAITTIGLKMAAFRLTGSVGLLSDALESIVNLVAAILALAMLLIAALPPDEEHAYGHSKAEYFASAVEGLLILLAAGSIAWTAFSRIQNPQQLEASGLGILMSTIASVVNFGVARVLLRASKQHRSITLEADAKHLMTDVWTSLGVLAGIGVVFVTGWTILDPIIALLVAANIVWSGVELIRRSTAGLMDAAIPVEEQRRVTEILDSYAQYGVSYHALRTRQAAARRFVSVHVLLPNTWSIERSHTLVERMEADIRLALPQTTVFTHLEPKDDPASFEDIGIDRGTPSQA